MFIHSIQLQIALASIDLLSAAEGSRFVYSTCSLNPLEDEAVVCEILRRHAGTLRLVDLGASMETHLPAEGQNLQGGGVGRPLSDKLQHLRRFKWRNGLSWWRTDVEVMVNEEEHDVQDSEDEGEDGQEDGGAAAPGGKRKRGDNSQQGSSTAQSKERKLAERQMQIEKQRSITKLPAVLPSMLPPSKADEAKHQFHLDRSMRVMPHDQNTGGFFIAVFERYAAPVSPSTAAPASSSVTAVPTKGVGNKKDKSSAKDDINGGLDESGVTHEKELSILKNICGFNPKQISLSAAERESMSAAESESALLEQWRKAVSAYNYESVSPAMLDRVVQAAYAGADSDARATTVAEKNSNHLVGLLTLVLVPCQCAHPVLLYL
jgi:hypothetical protein